MTSPSDESDWLEPPAERGPFLAQLDALLIAHHLTPALLQRISGWCDEWLRLCTSTTSADRPRAEAAISELYRDLDEQPPRFVWVDSPRSSVLHLRGIGSLRRVASRLRSRLVEGLPPEPDGQIENWIMSAALRSESFPSDPWHQIIDDLVAERPSGDWTRCANVIRNAVSSAETTRLYACYRDVVGVRYEQTPSRRLDLWQETLQSCGSW